MARESHEVWGKRVQRWQDSGLTSKEFGAEIGVNPRTLSFWKWKLGKERRSREASKSSPRPKRKSSRRASRSPKKKAVTFVEATPTAPLGSTPCVVVIGAREIRVPPGFDVGSLRQILDVLETR